LHTTADFIAFATENKDALARYVLVVTGTTGQLIAAKCGLITSTENVIWSKGGNAQIASKVAEGMIDEVFFFVDPLGQYPHDTDIQRLLQIYDVYDVPLAKNPTHRCIYQLKRCVDDY